MADKLSADQLAECRRVFDIFDKDNDGVISGRDLLLAMRVIGVKITKRQKDQIIKEIGLSHTGVIDLDEFINFMARELSKGDLNQDERQTFQMFDRNGDGYITTEEIRYVMRDLGEEITQAEAEAMVESADLDGDGKINFPEFLLILK